MTNQPRVEFLEKYHKLDIEGHTNIFCILYWVWKLFLFYKIERQSSTYQKTKASQTL